MVSAVLLSVLSPQPVCTFQAESLGRAWLSPSGEFVATTDPEGVLLLETAGCSLLARIDYPEAKDVEFSPDGRTVAVAGPTGTTLYSTSGKVLTQLSSQASAFATFSRDGKLFATDQGLTLCSIYETKSWKTIDAVSLPFEEHEGILGYRRDGALFSRDRKKLLVLTDITTEGEPMQVHLTLGSIDLQRKQHIDIYGGWQEQSLGYGFLGEDRPGILVLNRNSEALCVGPEKERLFELPLTASQGWPDERGFVDFLVKEGLDRYDVQTGRAKSLLKFRLPEGNGPQNPILRTMILDSDWKADCETLALITFEPGGKPQYMLSIWGAAS